MPERKTLNEDLFYKGSSANLPRLHTCENKTPFWDKSKFFASHSHDFWLLPKLRGCRFETSEEMKEAMTKVIITLTQKDFHGAFQKLLERYKCIAAGGDYFEGD